MVGDEIVTNEMPGGIELEFALLKILSSHTFGLHTREMKTAVAEYLELSNEVLRVQRNGSRLEFAYRLSWARTKAKEKGLIERIDVAVWKITQKGVDYLGQM